MKVEFDRIRREFLPDGTDTYVEVVVTSGGPTLQAVSAAVDAANEPEQDRYPDDPGASEVIGPWPVPGAANRFTIQVRPPLDIDVLQDWFTRFAELHGRFVPRTCPRPSPPTSPARPASMCGMCAGTLHGR